MGAAVVERPAELAGDAASVDAGVRHAASAIELGGAPVVILYANVPVRPPRLIDRALELLAEPDVDSVQSFTAVGKHHPWWTCRVDAETGRVEAWDGGPLFHGVYRRQGLAPAFIPDGGVIAVTRDALFLEVDGVPQGPHAFLGREQNRRGVMTEPGDVIDIDSPIDLRVADAVLRERSPCPDAVISGARE
jgi:N-acylneuraminate cytidylyltransferase